MSKFITNCIEFRTGDNAHIQDLISDIPVDNKEKVLNYLKNGKDDGVCCSSIFDFVSSSSTGNTIHCYTDGEFSWDDEEIYHFEKYNIKLDEEFISKIIA